MAKHGDGLAIEFVRAVRAGLVREPFTTEDVKVFAQSQGWNPSSNYVNVLLSNSSSLTHSLTYKKYFSAIGDGNYILSELGKEIIL